MTKTFTKAIARLVVALTLGLTAPAPVLAGGDYASAIRHLMMATFDRPDAALTVEPVTIYRDIAVAGCAQGDMGGRALLKRRAMAGS